MMSIELTIKNGGGKMLNKLLSLIGLTTIKRARTMSRTLFDFYLSSQKQNNIKNLIWWSIEYEKLLKENVNEIKVLDGDVR